MERNDLDPLAALQPITRYPALLVGLGGTGEKALRFVRWLAESPNNQDLQCMLADGSLALFGIDTDPASATEGGGVPLSVIPADLRGGDTREDRAILPPLEDYLVIERSAIEEAYEKLRDEVFRSQERGPDDAELSQEHACILDWLPKPKAGEAAMMSVGATTSQGASQWRPLGRIGLFVKAVRISEELRRLYERVRLAAVRMGQKPRVFVLASLAGGTGGGMFWDIAFMMRLIDRYAYIRGYFLLPDVFEGVDRAGRIWPNAYGALKELAVFKNWRQEPNDTFRVSYPLRGADNEYIAYSGSRPAYNSVFLFRAFPPDIACDPRDASLGDDDRQRFASEVIDKTCLEVARNALCHLRVDVQEELGVGHNNESGDDSDTFRDQKEGSFVFCTSAVAELDVKSIDHLVKRFQATALSRLFKGFDTEAPGQIDQRGLLQELFEGWDPDDGRSDISESDAKNIAVSCLLDQGPIALTDWIAKAERAKEELAAHLISTGDPAMASLGKLDVATLFEKAIPERVRKGWRDDALDKKRKAEFPEARLAYVDQLYRIDERIDRARDALERAAAEMSDSNWKVLHPSDAARLSAFRKLVAGAEQTTAKRPEVIVTAPPEYLLGRIFFGVVVQAERGLQRVRERHGDEGAPEYLQTVIEAFLASLKRLEIDYRPNGAESSGADKDGPHERARQAVLDHLLARSSEILQPVTAIERADNANRERREVYREKLRGPIGEIGSYAEKTEELAPLVEPLTRKIADLELRQQGPVHGMIADQLASVLAADPRVPEFVGDRGASKDDLCKVLHEELAGPLEDMCRDLESSGREPIEIFIDTLLKFPHTLNIKRIGTPIEFEKALKYHRLLSEFFVMYWLDQHEFFLGRLGGEGGARRLL
ncbi:MAG: hypothetical protein O7B26_09785, partial [Planctomycetota bacterium]|nr:hypothetical protein [Planctomycetota bacterium]